MLRRDMRLKPIVLAIFIAPWAALPVWMVQAWIFSLASEPLRWTLPVMVVGYLGVFLVGTPTHWVFQHLKIQSVWTYLAVGTTVSILFLPLLSEGSLFDAEGIKMAITFGSCGASVAGCFWFIMKIFTTHKEIAGV